MVLTIDLYMSFVNLREDAQSNTKGSLVKITHDNPQN